MDAERKKQLRQEYAERKPVKGVFEIRCLETGERFFGIARDFRADCNSNRARLEGGSHPNKRLQELWKNYGATGFDFAMIEELEYNDPHGDYMTDLEAMRDLLLEENPKTTKVWK